MGSTLTETLNNLEREVRDLRNLIAPLTPNPPQPTLYKMRHLASASAEDWAMTQDEWERFTTQYEGALCTSFDPPDYEYLDVIMCGTNEEVCGVHNGHLHKVDQ